MKHILLLLAFFANLAFAGGLNPTDIANTIADQGTNIASAASLVKEAMMVKNQVEMINDDVKNSGKINDYQWQDLTSLTGKINNITNSGQAISYANSNVDEQFRNKYPDYSNNSQSGGSYTDQYQSWNKSTLGTIENSLKAAGMSLSNFSNEQNTLNTLENQGKSATGRMQVLQAATAISAQNVNQVAELRQLTASQANAQNAYMAYKVSKDSQQEKDISQLANNAPDEFPAYQSNPKIGEIPHMEQ